MTTKEVCKQCEGKGKLTFYLGIRPKKIVVCCEVCKGKGWIRANGK